jgi:tetratricopeptide (TPR) repeat protein
MKALQLIFCCLVILIAGYAQADQDFFAAGNQAYLQGQYDRALALYGQAAVEKGYSPALLYNMGNCFARLDKTGPAVLAYERTLLLDPGDRDARANLALVRSRAHLPDPGRHWWQQGVTLLGPDQWLMGSVFLFAVSILLLLVITRKSTRLVAFFLFVALLLAGGMVLAAYQGYGHWQENVVLKEANLLISPFAAAKSQGRLGAGQLVRVIKNHQEFSLVQGEHGNKGWLRTTDIARIDDLQTGLIREKEQRNNRRQTDQEDGR